ncbi:DUF3156 family protein [Burkholderia pseudomultivorans]|uniref:DUF3156 domain-containing protein n=1 Tax=Burkholderia pseudomultivorans TaxID=1207504 RepID=A0ABU2E831_9BURK|nr:DUF3156 family protein [Burkholderia pseudomultivorans]MDR8727134.1 hypothetical protein [Burkholderia pseudomultivorans]MDR8733026.1 hypothetical protein [Burkholderia pseudomultivorans]MDR8739893.1 hypothetical protein [Burkholderia pseudomultivorans]MDR8756025.1 hypothetical protein [Burkholderia pseudomultivorans]MDR8775999.1 hypothetical protein [Burkholderia pseudomultivorans]
MKAVLARWRTAPVPLPAGHRPGAIAARVLADLRAVRDADGATARLPNGVCVRVAEQVDRQFLMHTVSVKVTATARGPAASGHARVRQTGWLRRSGVQAVAAPGCDPAFERTVAALLADPPLADALRPLHLTDCAIDARDGRWTLAVVPFGGSEVVNRMPSFRRYVRLIDEQADALSAACLAFETALRRILRG